MFDDKSIKLSSCQIALFFEQGYNLKPLAVAGSIQEKLSGIFSVEPSTMSFPHGTPVPLEIPKIFIQGDPAGQITVTSLRADLVLNLLDRSESLESTLSQIAKNFADCFPAKFTRFGFTHYFNLIQKDAISIVRDEYLRTGKFEKIREMNLGWLNSVNIHGVEMNRMVNIVINPYLPNNAYGVLSVDTNTRPVDNLCLDSNNIKDYIDECVLQYRNNITTYIEHSI